MPDFDIFMTNMLENPLMKIKYGIIIIGLLLVACGKSQSPQTKVLAKYDGGEINQEFMDLAIQSMPENQQVKLKESAHFQEYFNKTLKARLYGIEAEKALINKYKDQEDFVTTKGIAGWYQQYHLGENLGFTTTELLMHFEKNEKLFTSDDSTLVGMPLFDSKRSDVARDLALEQKEFKEFYEKNKMRFRKNPEAELSWIWTKKKGVLAGIKELLDSNKTTWGDAVKTYSELKNPENGSLGFVGPVDARPELKPYQKAFRTDLFMAKKWATGSYQLVELAGEEALFKVGKVLDEKIRSYDEAKDDVLQKFVGQYQQLTHKNLMDSLKLKYKIKIIEDKTKANDLMTQSIAIYQENPQDYMSQAKWKLWIVQESKLDTVNVQKKSLPELQALGFVDMGWVLAKNSMPQSFGIVRGLEKSLNSSSTGFLKKSLVSAKGKVFIYVEAYKAPKLKEFERVKRSIELKIKNGQVENMDASVVLVKSKDNMEFITGFDWNQVLNELAPSARSRVKKEDLIDYLISLKLFGSEANNHGFTLRPEIKVKIKLLKDSFWSMKYEKELAFTNIQADYKTLQALYKSETEIVNHRDFDAALKDLKVLSTISELDWKYLSQSAWKGTIKDPKNHKQLYVGNYNKLTSRMLDQQLFQLMNTNKLVVDSSLNSFWKLSIDSIYQEALVLQKRSLAKENVNRVIDGKNAINLFDFLFHVAPDYAKLDSAYYQYAKIMQTRGLYNHAIMAYDKILIHWPKSPMAFRAAFLKGYVFYENLKKDDKAIKSFEFMLANYPKTELSDDADVLLKDLKSGRTHLKKIMDNLGK